jgi:hypothetical protein
MNTRLTLVAGLAGALCAASIAPAQVPDTLYMQGLFLKADGTADAGMHSVEAVIYSNAMVALDQSTQVTANADGLANFTLSNTNLPLIFQTSTNVLFNLHGSGPIQAFVTTPYAFQAGNLSMASGNFTVWGDMDVAGSASMVALTATNGALLNSPVAVARFAYFTNLDSAVFDGSLAIAGGAVMDGTVEANYDTVFSSGTATSLFYAATNSVVLNNAVIQQSFTCITTNLPSVSSSTGTAAEDGFLLVWITVDDNETSGVYVNIGNLKFTLKHYANAAQLGQSLHMYTGATYPVPQGTTWSTSLVDAGDKNNITIQCYWIPLRGGG